MKRVARQRRRSRKEQRLIKQPWALVEHLLGDRQAGLLGLVYLIAVLGFVISLVALLAPHLSELVSLISELTRR